MLVQHSSKSWQPLRRALLVITLVSFAFIVVLIQPTIFRKISQSSSIPLTVKAMGASDHNMNVGLPIRLKIPAINVDTTITYAGITPDGLMDITKDPNVVAWYELGPRPGQLGSAVIAGHYGWMDEKAAIFNKLHTLSAGDEIFVVDSRGLTTAFVVTRSQKYNPDADAADVFKSNDGKAHLNLVTCNGTWDNAKQSYSNRLVIFADKEI
ncbi:MAG: class F sortase [Candidatus Saccharimonadales bacterium]